jgi:hypothetical protein
MLPGKSGGAALIIDRKSLEITARALGSKAKGATARDFAFFYDNSRSKAIGCHGISVSFRELLSFIRRIYQWHINKEGLSYGKRQKKEQTGNLYIERIRSARHHCRGIGSGYAWQHQD